MNDSDQSVANNGAGCPTYKLYRRRWFMLIMFIIYMMSVSSQFIQYPIISTAVSKYYGTTNDVVDYTTECFMISYIILVFPGLWLMGKLGIRWTMVVSCLGMAIATWIKFLALKPDGFYFIMIGQIIISISAVCTYGIANRLAAVWFGAAEISLAGCLALLGDQIGGALGFLVPTIFVSRSEDIGTGIRNMNLTYAIISSVILLMVFFFFERQPKTVPSGAQEVQHENASTLTTVKSLKNLLVNPSYRLIFFSYGISIGSFSSFSILLSGQIELYFPEENEFAGKVGFVIVISGISAALICGWFLDKTRLFKETVVFVAIGSFISMVLFTVLVTKGNIHVMYAVAALQGMFWVSYLTTSVQIAIEVSFPISEDIIAALLLLSAYVHSIFITQIYGRVTRLKRPMEANIFMCGLLCIAFILAMIIPKNMNRQNAERTVFEKKTQIVNSQP